MDWYPRKSAHFAESTLKVKEPSIHIKKDVEERHRCPQHLKQNSTDKTTVSHIIWSSHYTVDYWKNIAMTHVFPTVKFSFIRIKQHTSAESCFLFSSSLERENTITVGYHHGDSRNFLMKVFSHFKCMVQPGKKWALW